MLTTKNTSTGISTADTTSRRTVRVSVVVAALLLAGAIWLAITRADALLIDLAALAQCF